MQIPKRLQRLCGALMLLLPITALPQVNIQDSLALVDIYQQTGGLKWRNNTGWLDGAVTSWYGIGVTGDRVTGIDLSENNLQGILSPLIGNLDSLHSIDLHSNNLHSIPGSIGKLVALEFTDLHNCQLTGPIPTSIGRCKKMQELHLSGNPIYGEIPDSVQYCTNLRVLDISNTSITGNIPATLSKLENLEALLLRNCQLSGEFAIGIGQFQRLKTLDASHNHFTAISSSAGNLGDSIRYLDLSHNEITGSIPPEIKKLKALQTLLLNDNTISGAIPSELCHLQALVTLNASSNQLTGSLPENIGELVSLQHLVLSNNQITGPLPSELVNLHLLTDAAINNNNLNGNLPAGIDQMQSLTTLDLSFNKLTGSIPGSIALANNLDQLNLSYNLLTGSLPSTFSNRLISYLNLSHNMLSGQLPPRLKVLRMHFNDNMLTGTTEAAFIESANMTELFIAHNHLSGNILESISNCYNLVVVDVSDNEFSGTIPLSFKYIKNLSGLNLRKNHFSGHVPFFNYKEGNQIQPDLSENAFTFEGMEEFASTYIFAPYAPQANIAIHKSGNILSVGAGGTLSENTYNWYRDGQLVKTVTGDSTLAADDAGVWFVTVSNSRASKLQLTSNTIHLAGFINFCVSSASGIIANDTIYSASHQWQVNTGEGYSNLKNDLHFNGIGTGSLSVLNLSGEWAGTRLRCLVNGEPSGEYWIRFVNNFNGSVSEKWENPANWDCQLVPDASTTAIIEHGTVTVNESTSVYNLIIKNGVTCKIKPGVSFSIKH